MKTTASLVCLAACLGSLPFIAGCATRPNETAYSHHAKYVERRGILFGRGTSYEQVLEILGPPHRQLNENNWIYRHFSGLGAQTPGDDCDTLLIVFSDGEVENLSLINAAAERIFAARLESLASHLDAIAVK